MEEQSEKKDDGDERMRKGRQRRREKGREDERRDKKRENPNKKEVDEKPSTISPFHFHSKKRETNYIMGAREERGRKEEGAER